MKQQNTCYLIACLWLYARRLLKDNTGMIFIVLSVTAKPYARVHLGLLSESRSAPGGRQLVGRQAADLTFESLVLATIGQTFTRRHSYYYSAMWLYSFYCPMEDRRLSRPRHCSKVCIPWPKLCVAVVFMKKKNNFILVA